MLPLENMPAGIYYLTYLDPLRFFVTIVRGIFLKGSGFFDLIPEISAIILWAVFYMSAAVLRFQKRIG